LKVLVLSDIHYPYTLPDQIAEIVKIENADTTIFLGDSTAEGKSGEFVQFIRSLAVRNPVFIIGDNEMEAGLTALLPYVESTEIKIGDRKFKFIHGHQFNVRSDEFTSIIASIMKRVNRLFPVLLYALRARIQSRNAGCLILGHCHALAYFPKIKVACAGCLTISEKLYNDRGYITIQEIEEAGGKRVELSLKGLNGKEPKIYAI